MGNKDVVYHYCTLDTFLSIISSGTLWLSDIMKSNDKAEFTYCRDKVNERMEEYLKDDEEAIECWKLGCENHDSKSDILYAICFSEDKDLLSQWRGYGDDGRGVAIGFSREVLNSLNSVNKFNLAFKKVLYGEENQSKLIDNIVKDNIEKLQYKSIAHVAMELNSNYDLEFSFCKNNYFIEEKEWRIIRRQSRDANLKCPNGIVFKEKLFRVRNDMLVSYVIMDFSEIKKDFIKEIWIGPKAKVQQEDIMNLMNHYGYYKGTDGISSPILIEKSRGTYR